MLKFHRLLTFTFKLQPCWPYILYIHCFVLLHLCHAVPHILHPLVFFFLPYFTFLLSSISCPLYLFLSGPSEAFRDVRWWRATPVWTTLQPGNSTLDTERQGAPGIRPQFRLSDWYGWPPNNRSSHPTERHLPLLCSRELSLSPGLSLHSKGSHRSLLPCRAHSHN